MSKLIIDCTGFEHGKSYGYETFLLNLLEYFSEKRNDLKYSEVIIACDENQTEYFKNFSGMEVYGLNSKGNRKKIIQQNLLWKTFHVDKKDVILFPGNYSALTKHCHHVLVIHDLLFQRKKLLGPGKTAFYWQRKLFIPRSIKLADKVIAISNWVKDDIISYYPKQSANKTEAIYSYFDFNKYGNNPSDEIEKLAQNKYFLVVSADYPHKNIATVINAFSVFAKSHFEYKLIIIGNLSDERKALISSLSKDIKDKIIILKGISDDDLGLLYRNAKAFISATEFEGLGMPLVEAMYLGTKVISSNLDVAREVTMDKAIYFNPKDDKQLLNIMDNLDKYEMPINQKDIIEKRYCAENTSGKYIELLNSFIV